MKSMYLLGWCLAVAACGEPPPEPKTPPPPVVPSATTSPPAPVAAAPDRAKLPAPAPLPRWALPKPEIFTLDSGIKVYFLKQGPTPLVSVVLLFPRGGATDPAGKAGLTALTADLLDEGAGDLDALGLSEEFQRLATDYSASTDVDSVMLEMDTIADSFDSSVKLLADIARRPKLDPKEFTRRKEQRSAEALAGESEPTTARAVVQRAALFGEGYGSHLASGTRPTLARISYADVKAHYAGFFAPEGASIVVVGGIDVEPVKAALTKSFGDWKGTAKTKSAAVSDHAPEKGVYFVDFPDATQSAMSVGRRAPGENTPEYFPALVLSRVLGESFTSRLNLNLREAKGFTYGASSSFRRWRDVGLFALAANVKREATRASIDETLKEIRDLCASRPITKQERDEAVGGLLLGFPGRFERGGDVASQLSSLPLYGRADDWLEKWSDRVQAVDTPAANQLATSYCNPDEYVIVLSGDREVVEPTLEGLGRKVFYYDAQGTRLKGPPKRPAKPKTKGETKPKAAKTPAK